MALEEAAEDLDAVAFVEVQVARGGHFVVGGEAGDGLLEELELAFADVGVGGAGAGALPVAPGEVADLREETADVGELGTEEYYAVDEGTLSGDDLFADGTGDFLAGVEELYVGEEVAKELDAAADLGEADTGTERHGIPAGRVFQEYFSYLGKIFLGRVKNQE